jgi:hypothetical protein
MKYWGVYKIQNHEDVYGGEGALLYSYCDGTYTLCMFVKSQSWAGGGEPCSRAHALA